MADCSLNLALIAVHEEFNTGDVTLWSEAMKAALWRSQPWLPFCPGEDALIGMFPAY
jgi:hypothetical protein